MRSFILFTLASTLTATAALAGQPDIVVDDIRATVVGDDVIVTVEFSNAGDADSGAFWVDLYSSKAGAWSFVDQMRHYDVQVADGLEIGQVSVRSFTLLHNEWENNGLVYGTVDVDGSLAEGDDTNNLGQLYILDVDPNEPVHPCSNFKTNFPAVLPGQFFMTAAFLAEQQPHLYCKSRVL